MESSKLLQMPFKRCSCSCSRLSVHAFTSPHFQYQIKSNKI